MEVKIPRWLADYPVLKGVGNQRLMGDVVIVNPVSPLTFKILLLAINNKNSITSLQLKGIVKHWPSGRLRRAKEEIEKVKIRTEGVSFSLAKTELLPFGRWKKLKIKPNFPDGGGYVKLPKELLLKARNTTHFDLLVLLLWSRPQTVNYLEFLTEYLLGVDIEKLEAITEEEKMLKVRARVIEAYKGVHESLQRLGIEYSYKNTRIAIGKFTVSWFERIEFKKEEVENENNNA